MIPRELGARIPGKSVAKTPRDRVFGGIPGNGFQYSTVSGDRDLRIAWKRAFKNPGELVSSLLWDKGSYV